LRSSHEKEYTEFQKTRQTTKTILTKPSKRTNDEESAGPPPKKEKQRKIDLMLKKTIQITMDKDIL
jgi:hypothetical protein